MEERKCPSCGKVIPLDAVFCGYCGTKISAKIQTYAQEQRSLKDLISTIKWKYVPVFEGWTASTVDETNPTYYSWNDAKKDIHNFLIMVEHVKRLFPKAEGKIKVYLKSVKEQMEIVELKVKTCEDLKERFMDMDRRSYETILEFLDEGLLINEDVRKIVMDNEKHLDWLLEQLKEAISSYKREIIELRRILLDLCEYIMSIEKII